MEFHAKELDGQPIKHITKRYVLSDAGSIVPLKNLLVIVAFGKVLPVLLAGDTVVLIGSPVTPVSMLRISEYLRELVPPGVFNFVASSHDLALGKTSDPGIELITFTRSAEMLKPESPAGMPALGKDESIADSGRIASGVITLLRNKLFGSIELIPMIRKPGRHGLASALFEILSFHPRRMKTQVLVWGLARKASYTFPRAVH
jgi:hypothetical protein